MEGTYNINLIPNDLSVEETVLQIADALDNLNGIIDDVFTRISAKINHNMNKTMELQTRIDTSKQKVDKLAGMQKAIKVFSSAKYPASIIHEHYKSIFDNNTYNYKPKTVTLSTKSKRPSNEKGIQEKLHFFHVKVAEPKTRTRHENELKTVIERVSSVGELLIFNTDESPYIGVPSKQQAYVPVIADVKKTVLDEAPPSIRKGNVLTREIDEYMYAPGMGMVPELDMPLDLPHLPGVAGDIQYSFSDDGTIAPSAVTSPVAPTMPLPELPDVSVLPDVKPDVSALVEDVVGKVPDVPDAPPAPPMPVAIPPPPPPPPMDIVKPVKNREEIPVAPSGGDAHSNLMAAIRQAGGAGRAKLKAAASTTSEMVANPGGDLMADLHAKLSMRRRGISGAERSSGGTVLHTLASVIPEPDELSDPQQSSSDDDWK